MSSIDIALARSMLGRCPLFRAVAPADLERCCAELRHRHSRRGEVIFHAGDAGDALHTIISGAVSIQLPSRSGGEPAILATLGPGEFFGELAILDEDVRSASAVATEPTETFVLRRDSFLRLVDENPSLRHSLLASLAGELRRLTAHVESLHFLDLSGRLARRIVAEAETAAPGATSTVRIAWPYTQSEVAGMIGGSRESVNRILGDFSAQGLVALERDALVVNDLGRLANMADG